MHGCGSAAGIVCAMLSLFVLPTLSGLFAAAFHSQTQQGRERGIERFTAVHDSGDKDKKRGGSRSVRACHTKQTYSERDRGLYFYSEKDTESPFQSC